MGIFYEQKMFEEVHTDRVATQGSVIWLHPKKDITLVNQQWVLSF